MIKILSVPNNPQKALSIKLPIDMFRDMDACVKATDMKNRSKWVSSAIIRLEKMSNYCDLISDCWSDLGNYKQTRFILTAEATKSLLNINKTLKACVNPTKEWLSLIVRTAIIQFIINSKKIRKM